MCKDILCRTIVYFVVLGIMFLLALGLSFNTGLPYTTATLNSVLDIKTIEEKYGTDVSNFVTASLNNKTLEFATLVKVVDGDTVVVDIVSPYKEENRKVRYIGIDSPEVYQNECFSQQATEYNMKLLSTDKYLVLVRDVRDTDKYGRLLRYVFVKDTFVNAQLIMDGYAKALTIPPDVRFSEYFVHLEQQARDKHVGLWGTCVSIR